MLVPCVGDERQTENRMRKRKIGCVNLLEDEIDACLRSEMSRRALLIIVLVSLSVGEIWVGLMIFCKLKLARICQASGFRAWVLRL